MENSWREKFLAMSPDARRRLAAANPIKGCVPRYPRLTARETVTVSKDALIQFGRRHRCLSRDRLERALATAPDFGGRITAAQVIWLFDGWDKYLAEVAADPAVWGDPALLDDDSLARFCAAHGMTTRDAYRAKMGTPAAAVLPNVHEIEARFGSWGLFGLLCRTYSIDYMLDRYYRECVKAKRRLGLADAAKLGIDLQGIIAALGKPLFDELLHIRESADRAEHAAKKKEKDAKAASAEDPAHPETPPLEPQEEAR